MPGSVQGNLVTREGDPAIITSRAGDTLTKVLAFPAQGTDYVEEPNTSRFTFFLARTRMSIDRGTIGTEFSQIVTTLVRRK